MCVFYISYSHTKIKCSSSSFPCPLRYTNKHLKILIPQGFKQTFGESRSKICCIFQQLSTPCAEKNLFLKTLLNCNTTMTFRDILMCFALPGFYLVYFNSWRFGVKAYIYRPWSLGRYKEHIYIHSPCSNWRWKFFFCCCKESRQESAAGAQTIAIPWHFYMASYTVHADAFHKRNYDFHEIQIENLVPESVIKK